MNNGINSGERELRSITGRSALRRDLRSAIDTKSYIYHIFFTYAIDCGRSTQFSGAVENYESSCKPGEVENNSIA